MDEAMELCSPELGSPELGSPELCSPELGSPELCESFEAQVDLRPGAAALVWHGEETSYRRLFEMACNARIRLELLGSDDEVPVGILAKKSPAAIALVMGCFMAGKRFLLPSTMLAPQSLQRLFQQAGCRHVLSPEATRQVFEPSPHDHRAADAACLLTTSGSTGLPKVVPLGRAAVDRFISWAGEQFNIQPGMTVLNYAPLNFDLCFLDIWTTLARGGRVALVDPDLGTNGNYLLDLMVDHEVQVVQAVPMFYRLLIDTAQKRQCRLDLVEQVIFTGDALPERTLFELPHLFANARLYNIYGCTETNDSFIHEVDTTVAPVTPVPLGHPLPGVRALIVDADGTVLDGPGVGELYVSTPFQTAGYLDATRNAQAFAPHPQGLDDLRYFRSGDIVRRYTDGRLVIQGRRDFQVKVRGVAVNTAEVENVLLQHPEVVEAAVVAVSDPVAGRRLCCTVQRTPGGRLNSLVLRQHCAQSLPHGAIPTEMLIVDEPLPRTSTGKIDHNAANRIHTSPDHKRVG